MKLYYNPRSSAAIIRGGPPERPKLKAYVDRLLERPAAMKIGG